MRLLSIPQVAGIKMATLDSIMTYQDVSPFGGEVPGSCDLRRRPDVPIP